MNLSFGGQGIRLYIMKKICSYEQIKIKYIVDSDENKIGSCFCGYKVLDPSVLYDENKVIVLISTSNFDTCCEIKRKLSNINKNIVSYSFDEFVLRKNIGNICRVSSLFEDITSQKIYSAIIQSRINGAPVSEDVYCVNSQRYNEGRFFQTPRHDDIIVDAGAFVGDSLEKFLFDHDGIFSKYFAFEPDSRYFSALKKRCLRLSEEWVLPEGSIIPVNKCLTQDSGFACLHNWPQSGGGSSICSNEVSSDNFNISKVLTTSLDEFFHDENVTFIKADIEGAEYSMLEGSINILTNCKPRLAISVYHNPSDLYRIPLLLEKLNVGYKFYFRHYSYTWGDSVLYAF